MTASKPESTIQVYRDVTTGGGVGCSVTPPNEHNRYSSGKFTESVDAKSVKPGLPYVTGGS